MAITIFLMLNVLGVVFLLYVLANFLKEGRKPENNARIESVELERSERSGVVVVTHPISHSAQGGVSVIPFRTCGHYRDDPAHRVAS